MIVDIVEDWTEDASLWRTGFNLAYTGEGSVNFYLEGSVMQVVADEMYNIIWEFELNKLINKVIMPYTVKIFTVLY